MDGIRVSARDRRLASSGDGFEELDRLPVVIAP